MSLSRRRRTSLSKKASRDMDLNGIRYLRIMTSIRPERDPLYIAVRKVLDGQRRSKN